MVAFVGVAWLEQLPTGQAMAVSIGDIRLALFNVGGTVHAVDDACLHTGSSLAAGAFEGTVVRCRGHGWTYDVTTGQVVGVPGLGVGVRAAKVVDGRIMVAID